ncbi:MAG: hypothetical protein CMJ18_19440 [Phycisphaeraceae bacterium]|nr:hypothetical protein [Phycisphaeraceae bacterium]
MRSIDSIAHPEHKMRKAAGKPRSPGSTRPLTCARAFIEEEARSAAEDGFGSIHRDPAWDPELWPYTRCAPGDKRSLRAAVATWHRDRDAARRNDAIAMIREKIESVAGQADRQLRDRINELGGRDPVNAEVRDACFHHALLYHLTGDMAYARTAHAILQRFAEVIPDWKIYRTHYGEERHQRVYDQDWPDYGKVWDVAGIWGTWWYKDPLNGVPLAEAYDLIHDSNLMQDTGTLDAIEHMIVIQPLLIKNAPRSYGNMDGSTIRSILLYAELLREPQWVHDCAWWIHSIYKTQFYADGWWHEGAPLYHKHVHRNLKSIVREWLDGYSDPPGFVASDGTRFDNLDMSGQLAGPIARADHALATAIQPNGVAQVIHDTLFRQPSWWTGPMTEANSRLYGRVGHCILGAGKGEHMVQASLHFGGTHGHAHFDCLNVIYFAKGKELLSETGYRSLDAPDPMRPWHTMTAAHLTVVVDERSQDGRSALNGGSDIARREKQPQDAVPGIPDGHWRWAGHGDAMNDGRLRLFNVDFDMVQVARADGARAYAPSMEQYRRTIALVRINETDTYLVDIFRVRGGRIHDYMLHGCLDEPHSARTSIELNDSRDGTMHGYIGHLRSTKTDDDWSVSFELDDGSVSHKTFVAAQRGTEIIQGEAPAMRRADVAPFLAVRHADEQSVFVAVHHPYTSRPLVRDVKLLSSTRDAVKLRVMLTDRVDTVTSQADGFTHEARGRWRYDVGGRHTRRGTLIRTRRLEAGDAFNAFITRADLPTDGSLDGQTLMIDLGGLLVQSCIIDRVERRDGDTVILTNDEPGITLTEDLVKLEYFPNWGIQGSAAFVIAGSKLEAS